MSFFGGVNDIKKKTVKCINETVFNNDGLRILRFIRFVCNLNFKPDRKSLKAAKTLSYNLAEISKMRIFKELNAMFLCNSYKGNLKAIELFNTLNIYKYIFNNSFNNFKLTSKQVKVLSKSYNKITYYLFLSLCILNNGNTESAISSLKESNEIIAKVKFILQNLTDINNLETVTCKALINFNNLGVFEKRFLLNYNKSKYNKINKQYTNLKRKKLPFSIKELQIDGTDLLRLKVPQQKIGKILEQCLYAVMNEKVPNSEKELTEYIKYKL